MSTSYSSRYKESFPWCGPHPKDTKSAWCTWCNKGFKIDTMGRGAFCSHEKSKGHLREVSTRKSNLPIQFFATPSSSSTEGNLNQTHTVPLQDHGTRDPPTSSVSDGIASGRFNNTGNENSIASTSAFVAVAPFRPGTETQEYASISTIKKFLLNDQVTAAEILWAMETVSSHNSNRSGGSGTRLFKKMFTDSEIAARMEMGRTKLGYFITHGIAPYFLNILFKTLENCSEIVVGFDETLNKISQKQQMDIGVRFWSDTKQEVQAKYVGSAFLSSTRANDLANGLKGCFGSNPLLLKKIIQFSMDGPHVNWKLLKDVTAEIQALRENPSFSPLDIGSCGLHVVHNSFKNGMKKAEWHIDDFLSSLYYMFRDCPLRRADYVAVTGSDLFPLKFCNVRWVENQGVAARAANMLPFLIKYVSAVEDQLSKKLKPTHPNFKRSFLTVSATKHFIKIAAGVKDVMLGPKLNFFMSAAAVVEPFLREFQCDAPMVPFIFDDLTSLVKTVMEKAFKPECLKVSSKSLIDVELTDKNLLSAATVDIGFAAKGAIRAASKSSRISDQKILLFRQGCRDYYVGFLEKMFDRSPLAYPLTRYISCLSPKVVTTSLKVAKKRLEYCLEQFVDKDHLTSVVAEKVQQEYARVCDMPSSTVSMSSYRRTQTRLDHFWRDLISNSGEELPHLLLFVKKVLILSHGNAMMERGFSVNKECLVENLADESLVAQRVVCDAVLDAGGILEFSVTKSLIQYARNAHSKYSEALKQKKLERSEREKEAERKREAATAVKQLEAKKAKLIAEHQKDNSLIDEQIKDLKKLI